MLNIEYLLNIYSLNSTIFVFLMTKPFNSGESFNMGEFKHFNHYSASLRQRPFAHRASGGVLCARDIYARYLRLKNEDVLLIGGSDEHGVPITLKAKNENVTPQAIVDKFHGINKKSFEDFGISFDIYSRTSAAIHHETASEFFKKMYEQGQFIEKVSEQYYDEEEPAVFS